MAAVVAQACGPVVCFGMTEDVDGDRANTAVCLGPDGTLLGTHRKVHLPAGEVAWYRAGDGFGAIATPAGRVGLMVDYDKTFPESARCLALDGAEILVCPSAWPASRTNRAASPARDRQRRLFDLYDRARAAENQLWLVSANQTGAPRIDALPRPVEGGAARRRDRRRRGRSGRAGGRRHRARPGRRPGPPALPPPEGAPTGAVPPARPDTGERMTVRVALLTYSTRPRGGVVHTLALAEALARHGADVTVHALGRGGDHGFFRPGATRR